MGSQSVEKIDRFLFMLLAQMCILERYLNILVSQQFLNIFQAGAVCRQDCCTDGVFFLLNIRIAGFRY